MTVIILICKLSFVWCIGPICSLVHNISSDCTRYVCRFERGQRSRLRGILRQLRLESREKSNCSSGSPLAELGTTLHDYCGSGPFTLRFESWLILRFKFGRWLRLGSPLAELGSPLAELFSSLEFSCLS